ncbi:hypothetical protein [Amycolatopsis methanolica]|uniref:hypothetical protein n=1 Tax=Amycolatopsis methanolica TaxID=1814 RepID=UPI0034407C86
MSPCQYGSSESLSPVPPTSMVEVRRYAAAATASPVSSAAIFFIEPSRFVWTKSRRTVGAGDERSVKPQFTAARGLLPAAVLLPAAEVRRTGS